MVEKPEEYKWSSYSMFISKKKEKLLQSFIILNYFNVDNKRKEYKSFIDKAIKYAGKRNPIF